MTGAIDWTSIILAIIATGALGGFGITLQRAWVYLWRELVTKPREDLETLKKQLAAKDDIVTTNSEAFDRVATSNEKMAVLIRDMVGAWEKVSADSNELAQSVRALVALLMKGAPPGGGGSSGPAGSPQRPLSRPVRHPRHRLQTASTGRPVTGSSGARTTWASSSRRSRPGSRPRRSRTPGRGR